MLTLSWQKELTSYNLKLKTNKMNWYLQVLRNYAKFDGRARRTEYWMFILINIVVSFLLTIIDVLLFGIALGGIGILSTIYALGIFIPSLAVIVRRLHDTGKSGMYIFLAFIPIIGVIILLVFMITEGERGSNKYGPDPKEDVNPQDRF